MVEPFQRSTTFEGPLILEIYTEPELNVGQTLRLYSWPTYIGKVKVAPIWPT